MTDRLSRIRMLLGTEGIDRLRAARVAVFGLGGVGSYAVEALARSGIGALDLIDNDTVALSNLNRQLIATTDTLGMDKTEAAAARVRAVAPECAVRTVKAFVLPETIGQFDFSQYDYVVDAIDTVAGKLALVLACREAGTPLLSALGTGNKLDPTKLRVSDLYETEVDPLARVMRRELRRRGVEKLRVVWSTEPPMAQREPPDEETDRRSLPASTAFVPGAAGLLIASVIVRELTGN